MECNIKMHDYKNNILYQLKDGNGYFIDYSNGLTKSEYRNGERNGKGKEYDIIDIIKFEGEYRYGKKWNGKGYDIKYNIVYELINGNGYVEEYLLFQLIFGGEYRNGERNGKGKEYHLDGTLKFEGEYRNGKRIGKGVKYDKNRKLRFEGEYLYGFKRKGKFYINGILEYEGEFLFNKKQNGKGFDENGNIIYELTNGNGKVKEYNDRESLIFEVEYLNGKCHGKGREYLCNKVVFEGYYKDDKKMGMEKIIITVGN